MLSTNTNVATLIADFSAKHIGEVMSVPGGDGFGFININTVSKEDGSAHDLPTTENIFVHQDECASPLKVGMRVQFNIAGDHKRSNAFRATGAVEFAEVELLPANEPPVPGFNKGLTVPQHDATGAVVCSTRLPVHAKMKDVPAATVEKAVENRPMPLIPRSASAPDEQQQLLLLQAFLHEVFPTMGYFDADFSVLNADDAAFDAQVSEATENMQALGVNEEQIQNLLKETARFKEIRGALRMLFENGLVRPDTMIPVEYLPDLFMAVPVWFFWANVTDQAISDEAWRTDDPHVHDSVKYFCNLFPGNLRWAHTYQMFNRRLRTLKQYKGDVIPPHVTRKMRKAVELFDYVVIATPYHDVAGKDWEDVEWIRSIDPYVLGFKKGIPFFFLLARFSDTGLFPLFNELVADTIEFLKTNLQKLDGFNGSFNPYWYQTEDLESYLAGRLGDHLIQHTNSLIGAFEAGHLFDWLRGNDPDSASVPAVR